MIIVSMIGESRISMTKVSLAIVTYNNEKTIGRTLRSIVDNWPEDLSLECHIIDNDSTDDTLQKLMPYVNKIRVRRSEKGNVGFGSAHNLLLQELDSDYHIIMNPDAALLSKDTISVLTGYLDKNSDIGMVVPSIIDDKDQVQYLCRRELTVWDLFLRFVPGNLFAKRQAWHEMRDMDYTKPFDVPFASGCFFIIRTALLKELGGFDERFFLYAEDADLSKRVNQKARIVFLPNVAIRHLWERASYKSRAMTRLHLQSLWRYFRKWGFRLK